jgi:hypothetical protein
MLLRSNRYSSSKRYKGFVFLGLFALDHALPAVLDEAKNREAGFDFFRD